MWDYALDILSIDLNIWTTMITLYRIKKFRRLQCVGHVLMTCIQGMHTEFYRMSTCKTEKELRITLRWIFGRLFVKMGG
jgi:hypothetical protein